MAPSLFDLPFEDDPEPVLEPEPAPPLPTASPSSPAVPTTDGSAPRARSLAPSESQPPTAAGDSRTTPARTVLTVTAITVQIRDRLERDFFEVWVEGELSNCRLWNGHLYLTLKDDRSQLRGFMFRSSLRYLRFKPVDGLRVIARGKVSVYEAKGDYQLQCDHLEPQGLGALQLAFEQLKKRLHAEGLFSAERKRPLPALPRKIAIVTSLDGAAIRDIINVLGRRHHNAHIVIRPSRVQGEGAGAEVAHAIRAVSRVPGVDVVIVARGGGSIEDLWAFNEESVARAIAHSPVPVISGVGHESDFTIADFVADLRAPTPSAAAEMVVTAKEEFRGRIDRLADRARAALRSRVQRRSQRVHVLTARSALSGVPGRVAMRGRHASELSHTLTRGIRQRLASAERRLVLLRRRLDTFDLGRRLASIRTRMVAADGRLDAAMIKRQHHAHLQWRDHIARLEALSPLAVLGRGYAVAWNAERTRVLRDARDVAPGDRVRVTLAQGELECDVRDQKA